jgi:two-component system response regulator FlrC
MKQALNGNSPTLLIVEDDTALREALSDTLMIADYNVVTADNGEEALGLLDSQDVAMIISDVNMQPMDGHTLLKKVKQKLPAVPFLLMTAYGTIEKAVQAMHDGAVDYMVKPFEAEVLVNTVSRYVPAGEEDSDFIAESDNSRQLLVLAQRVADSDATVMITGESGSGKEVLARYIHEHSPRSDKPFVAINCAAIPSNMLEATLFGYEKGAFTGAYKSSPGKFEQAQGGTLLLDEISEMELALQAKLLRVLQEREVERLGGSKTIELDVRILATSNREMKHEVEEGKFREDLFYRLNVFPLHLAPLRERREDILPLGQKFVEKIAARNGRQVPHLSDQAVTCLQNHDWPGNVRELDNVMQRAMILVTADVIDARDIVFETAASGEHTETPKKQDHAQMLADDLKSAEQDKILEVLKSCMGNRSMAASRLGISQRTLRYKLARMRDAGILIPRTMSQDS